MAKVSCYICLKSKFISACVVTGADFCISAYKHNVVAVIKMINGVPICVGTYYPNFMVLLLKDL